MTAKNLPAINYMNYNNILDSQRGYNGGPFWGPYIGMAPSAITNRKSMLCLVEDAYEVISSRVDYTSLMQVNDGNLTRGVFRDIRHSRVELWPEITPFREGYLSVGDVHKVRYALYGNPRGRPVFFLHGGPGSGCSDADARWFDPDKYLIVTHDQRGSGKSIPRAEILDNTPQDLVEDIERLRKHLNIKDPIDIFGGSWGATLALLYAEAYPKNVSRMILRGVYPASYEDQDYLYSADGGGQLSPQAWEKFTSSLPPGEDRIQERLHRLMEEADLEGKKELCRIQSEYEFSFFDIPEEEYQKALNDFEGSYPEMRINNHYQANRFFLEDRQIEKNAGRIQHIPITIIQGMKDPICPPSFAQRLHRNLPNAKLVLVDGAGHLSSDPGIRNALLEALDAW